MIDTKKIRAMIEDQVIEYGNSQLDAERGVIPWREVISYETVLTIVDLLIEHIDEQDKTIKSLEEDVEYLEINFVQPVLDSIRRVND